MIVQWQYQAVGSGTPQGNWLYMHAAPLRSRRQLHHGLVVQSDSVIGQTLAMIKVDNNQEL